jgi:hypothetical protein
MGTVAGLRELAGDTGGAKAGLEKLGDGTAFGAPLGFVYYYLVCSEIEQATGWVEKAIEQRDPGVFFLLLLPLAQDLRQSSRWPRLSKMMNFPQSVS